MEEFISQYWLTLLVSIYILGMVLYGHYRGFIKRAVSVFALIASLVIVRIGMPYVTNLLKEETAIRQMVQAQVLSLSGFEDASGMESTGGAMPAAQRAIIEQLDLPETLKQSLIENNNSEVYEMLGVQAFSDYIADYLSNLLFSVIAFLVLFLFSYIIIRLLFNWVDIISKLPVLSGINQIAGAILGAIESLAVLWLIALLISVFSSTPFGSLAVREIESSIMVNFLYRNNPFQWIIMGILSSMLK